MLSKMQAWFSGGPSANGEAGSGSLLEDWNSYASSKSRGAVRDLEAAVPESFAPLLKTAGETFSGALNSVTNRVKDLPQNVQDVTSGTLPSRTALTYFGFMLSMGVFFVFLSFALFLPTMMARKFAISFTLGCILIMGSLFPLKGPKAQFFHMISRERLPFTLAFLASMFATIYVSMSLQSYLLSLVFSVLQVLCMLYYMVSYFPGGTTGLTFMGSMLTGSVRRCFGA